MRICKSTILSLHGIKAAKALASLFIWSTLGMPLSGAAQIASQSRQTSQPNLPSLGDVAREDLSPLMEYKLGKEIIRSIQGERDYFNDAVLIEYLNNFGSNLLAAHPDARGEAKYDFFFFPMRDPAINAFALPGGFIGVNSGLILAAQTEAELASVMAHEIGHVSQRHIARMLGQQRQDSLIPLASVLVAILASRVSSDASVAALMSGQGLALQRQLAFSRDAEREADRLGLQILDNAGFDTSGMVAFFGRLQSNTRGYSDTTPSFLRSHPLTTERIADIQARIGKKTYKQRFDSLDFHLIRARTQALQDESSQGREKTIAVFKNQLSQTPHQKIAANYGLALIALKQNDASKAESLLREARQLLQTKYPDTDSMILSGLSIDVQTALSKFSMAIKESEAAQTKFPWSRAIVYQYGDTLIAAGRYGQAVDFLRDQIQLYRAEPQLHDLLAKTYAAQNKNALQHMSLAESYALSGKPDAALDQLAMARRASDATFYDQAIIDARERELKTQRFQELNDHKNMPFDVF